MTLAERIIQARKYAALNQDELATKSGVTQQMISRLETGKQKTTTEIVSIAIACRVRPEWLALEQGEMTNKVETDYFQDEKLIQLLMIARELPEYGKDKAIKEITDLAEFINTATRAAQTK